MELLIPIIIFCFATSISPGPNNIMLMTSGVNHGVVKTIPHLLGINIGFPAMVAAIGFGLGNLFIAFPPIYLVIKVLGITYLLYLAWKIARSSMPNVGVESARPLTFMQAALFQWVNPKAWVMAVGAIASFTTSEKMVSQILLIVATYLIVGGMCIAVWLCAGAAMKKFLQNEKQLKIFNLIMALLLVASVVPMALVEINVRAQD